MRALALTLVALASVAGAEGGAALADALRLPAGSPRLAAMGGEWSARADELIAEFSASDPARRRGAARVAAHAGIPAARLAAALATATDAEVRRLGAAGLIGRLDGIAPATLIGLADPATVCALLANHPDPRVLADPALGKRLTAWLRDADACGAAAELIAARGDLGTHGPGLIAALSDEDDAIAGAAHQALCALTRTQRSFAAYAGHRDLLARDWQDALALAAIAPAGQVDAELLALVSELPEPAARDALLDRGAAALPALEQALAGADRARRRELQPVARLCARWVSSRLYAKLGEVGLAGMDASDPGARLTALREAGAAVVALGDPAGPMHVLTYVDDAEPAVRVAALDRLLRLEDDAKLFRKPWRLTDAGLFPPAHATRRLRRALRGSADEQVSALQVVATLDAKELADDIVAALMSPSAAAVETALAALKEIDPGAARMPLLLRLADDVAVPAPRRAQAIDVVAKHLGDWNYREQTAVRAESAQVFERILVRAGEDPIVIAAACRALVKCAGEQRQDALLVGMLSATPRERLLALDLIDDRNEDRHLAPVAAMLFATPPEGEMAPVVAQAAKLLAGRVDDDRAAVDLAIGDRRPRLLELCAMATPARPALVALGLHLGLLDRGESIELAAVATGEDADLLWSGLIDSSGRDLAALAVVIERLGAVGTLPDHLPWRMLNAVKRGAVFEPALLAEIVMVGAIDLIPNDGSSTDHGSAGRRRTIDLEGGGELVLKGVGSAAASDDDDAGWALDRCDVPAPDPALVPRLIAALRALRLDDEWSLRRDLICAVLERTPPPPAAAVQWSHERDLWLVLAARDPATRAALAAAINAEAEPYGYYLRPFLVAGQPDLVPAAVGLLGRIDDDDSDGTRALTYLASLPPTAVTPHLPALAGNAAVARLAAFKALLKKQPALPLAVALPLLSANRLAGLTIAPYGDDDLAPLGAFLAALPPEQILTRVAGLRLVRDASPATFDRALVAQVETDDARAGTWLRSGLPYLAGMHDRYRAALQSEVPEIWLAGAAFALKEKSLAMPAFLERVATLPERVLADAASVAARYVGDGLAGNGATLAVILRQSPARALAPWLALCPPEEPVVVVIAERARDGAVAGLIGVELATRLRADRATWLPIARRVAAEAGGRLDYLLPAEERKKK